MGWFPKVLIRQGGRQMRRAVADPPCDAVFQQAGQGAVHRREQLAQDQGQFPSVDEWQPGQGIQDALA